MNQTYPINIAVFKYKQSNKILISEFSSIFSKEDALITGLNEIENLKNETSTEIEMLEIYSEWKPTEETLKSIMEKHPIVKISYSFEEGDEEKFKSQMDKIYNPEKKWWKFW